MPINKPLGQTITFTATFFDANNVTVVPSSATLTITYPTAANNLTVVSCSIGMTATGSFFTASWASSVAAAGQSSYSVSAPGQITNAPGLAGTLGLM
jgi:hypothetical protein